VIAPGLEATGNDSGRSRIARALAAFNAALPRRGRVITQCKRAFLAHHPDPVTMTTLRQWCFAGQPRQHWQYWSIAPA